MLTDALPRQRTVPALLWTGAGAISLLVAQALGIAAYMTGIHLTAWGRSLSAWEILHNPLAIAGSTVVSVAPVAAFFWGLTRLRTRAVAEYLALRWPSLRAFFIALLGFLPLLAVLSVLPEHLFHAEDENFVRDIVRAAQVANAIPLVAIALTVAAPVTEELAFRGYLYRTLDLRFGGGAAIAVTALGWTLLHVQYSGTGMAIIFTIGLFLGLVRRYSASLYLTMILHGLWNGAALASVMLITGPANL